MRVIRKPDLKQVGKSALNVFILLAIFMIGVNVGNGTINFHKPDTQNAQLPNQLDYASVNKVYQALKENYDGKLTQQQLEDGLKHGLASSTKDPYTVYFTPKEAESFSNDLGGKFSGIGAEIGKDADGNIEVIAPIDGLPADKAGLKAKDIIININGQTTSDMTVAEAVSKIRGKAGTTVKLEVVRDRAETLDFTITRETIDLPSVTTETLDGNIGYIKVRMFDSDTVQLTRAAAESFKAAGAKAIVLDLRDNPGGFLDAAIGMSNIWLDKGDKILEEKRGGEVIDTQRASGRNNVLNGVPTVVLINSGSASASEIVAGALKDNKAAYVIGEKSYGKGVVQQLIDFRDGSQLKVTIASWYRPNGQNINLKGISPDKTVEITDEDAKADRDSQLEAAQAHLKQ